MGRFFIFSSAALWLGGVVFRSAPMTRRSDRWTLFWSLAAFAEAAAFQGCQRRHLDLHSLMVLVPLAVAFLLTLYAAFVTHPEIREHKRKMSFPEFAGSSHLKTIEFAHRRLQRKSEFLNRISIGVGVLNLILLAVFLK